MLSVMEAIQRRRSIRKFKSDPVPDELINQMLEAARLAPSGGNRQPWRFQVVRERVLKDRLFSEAVIAAEHVVQAPVIIVCGSELLTFVRGHMLAPDGSEFFASNSESWDDIKQFIPNAHLYTGLAVEHMILMATALGLGTCWVQRIRYGQMAKVLGWPRHIIVLALLLVGYPDEDPLPRPRLALEDIVLRADALPA